ncbi:MAG: hypothetical protein J5I47_07725 [Vicingus serpentipes]|nr:hypothetical protein [Vicingus serpentipes]
MDRIIDRFLPEMESLGIGLDEQAAKIHDEWELSSQKGTELHEHLETQAYHVGFITNPFDGKDYTVRNKPLPPENYDNISTTEFLMNLEDGVYTELLLFADEYQIAGLADEVFIETKRKKRYIDIGDHKFTKKKPKDDSRNGTCLYPIDHMTDCTYTKYKLQTNLYAYWLSLLGYIPRNIGIYHYTDYDISTKNVITFPFLNTECKSMLDSYLENILQEK